MSLSPADVRFNDLLIDLATSWKHLTEMLLSLFETDREISPATWKAQHMRHLDNNVNGILEAGPSSDSVLKNWTSPRDLDLDFTIKLALGGLFITAHVYLAWTASTNRHGWKNVNFMTGRLFVLAFPQLLLYWAWWFLNTMICVCAVPLFAHDIFTGKMFLPPKEKITRICKLHEPQPGQEVCEFFDDGQLELFSTVSRSLRQHVRDAEAIHEYAANGMNEAKERLKVCQRGYKRESKVFKECGCRAKRDVRKEWEDMDAKSRKGQNSKVWREFIRRGGRIKRAKKHLRWWMEEVEEKKLDVGEAKESLDVLRAQRERQEKWGYCPLCVKIQEKEKVKAEIRVEA